jgi:hypothetical protein
MTKKVHGTVLTSIGKICLGVPKRQQPCFGSTTEDIKTSEVDLGTDKLEVKDALSLIKYLLVHILTPQVL